MSFPDLTHWIVLGLLAGAMARALVPGDDRSGCLVTVALGIGGSFVGGWLGRYTGIWTPAVAVNPWAPSLASLATAVGGAIVLLSLVRFLRR
jgi:uncharacterized membrane protein YeaQ/YmgE (transglycosylase-associated protein family)